jgi:SpoVK/Ycf46/Vps4 family AAA+-type ATPase
VQVSWDDVGGLDTLKLQMSDLAASLHTAADVDPVSTLLSSAAPKGILLYGAPGCSKTLIARALATEVGANFISIKGGELYNKYVGESEKGVARLFSRARQVAPSIVFFDEIDGLTTARKSGGAGVPQL